MPPQEEYNDYHDGDTDEEIMTEAAPEPIIVLKDDEDPEEVIPKGKKKSRREVMFKVITMSKWRRMEGKSKLISKAQWKMNRLRRR
jgi:hypothetical protein